MNEERVDLTRVGVEVKSRRKEVSSEVVILFNRLSQTAFVLLPEVHV